MEQRLAVFLKENQLEPVRKISKGFSSEVFEVRAKDGKRFALKIERSKSTRLHMALKESLFLEKANSIGIGPKLEKADLENRAILMQLVFGEPFGKWVFGNVSKKKLEKTIESLLFQAKQLDAIGLDHGQLGGKGKNILVQKNGLPVIIDFEKASFSRRVHNASQLDAFLSKNPHSKITARVRFILGKMND